MRNATDGGGGGRQTGDCGKGLYGASMPAVTRQPDRRGLRRLHTRERLLEAAIALFTEHGFDATTMDDIARRARVGRSTLFVHFATKIDFLRVFYEEFVDAVLAAWEADRCGEYRRDLDGLLRHWGERAHRFKPVVAHLASLAMGHGPLAAAEEKADRMLAGAFHSCIAGARTRPIRADMDAQEHVALLLAMLTVTSHDWVNGGMTGDLAAMLVRRVDLLHAGLER